MMKNKHYQFTEAQEREYMRYVMGSAYCFPDERIKSIEEFYKVDESTERKQTAHILRLLRRRLAM